LVNLSREGYTFIKSTHFPDHALWVADRVIMMKQGSIIANGGSHETITSENLYSLYAREIDIHSLRENFRVCVPSRLGTAGKSHRGADEHRHATERGVIDGSD